MKEYNDWCFEIRRGVIDGVIIDFDDKSVHHNMENYTK